MKIAFLDSPEREYTVRTVDEAPLGGTQTAVSHVARGLAELGHQIILYRGTTAAGTIDGVEHLASSQCSLEQLRAPLAGCDRPHLQHRRGPADSIHSKRKATIGSLGPHAR